MSHSSDELICDEAQRTLRATGYAPISGLTCDVHDGVATLSGVVPTFHLRQVAHSALQKLHGVHAVKDLVEVHYAPAQTRNAWTAEVD